MAELNALNATAGNLEKRLQSLSVARMAGGTLIRDLQSVATPKFQWDEGLRQTDLFVKNLHRGKMEIQGITDFMEKWKNQSRDIAENQTRLANAVTRTGSGGQTQAYLPSVADIRNSTMALEAQNRQFAIQNEMLRVGSTEIQNWGKNMQWAGRQLMVGFTIPFAAAAAAAGVFAFSVDKEITRITKVYDGAKEEVKGLALSTAQFVTSTMGATAKSTLDVMAQLAAVGMKGEELKRGAIEVQRLSVLGEMDSDTALKSVIALMATFKQTIDETAASTNYMNALENATSLQMEDLAEAIPRAAAPIAQLGGSLQDLGTIMVALKERGVDAAEGANAIKTLMNRLINPAQQTKETFKALTGQELEDFIKKTEGKLMPTMQALAEIIHNGNMDLLERQQLIGRLGGAYQVTRLTAILDGLASKGGQVDKAFEIAAQGQSKWAASAEQELKTKTESISGRFQIAVESFKMQLQGFGEIALKMATFVISKLGDMMGALNSLPDWVKGLVIVGASILAIAGPLTMIIGIFGNFIGTIGRGVANIRNMGSQYKSLTIEQKAASIAAGDLKTKFMSEAETVQILVFQLDKLQKAYLETAQASTLAGNSMIRGQESATISRNMDKALANEKAEAAKLAALMTQQQEFISKNKGVPSKGELAEAEKMAYLEQARRDILANPRYTDQKRGLIFDPEMRKQYEQYGREMATADAMLISEQKRRQADYQAQEDKLTQQIRTQESVLTGAIKNRTNTTREALAAEKAMLLTGLKEQAAHAAALLQARTGVAGATPNEVMLGGARYFQSAGAWKKEVDGKVSAAPVEEARALNAGLQTVATTTGQVADNMEKSSVMAKVFSQEVLFAVSAVSAIGASVAGTNSGLASWLNYLALGAGFLSIIAPFFGQIADFVKNRDFVQNMLGGADGGKGKMAKFGSNLMENVSKWGRAASGLFFNPWTLGIAAVGVGLFAVYQLASREADKSVAHMNALASTTDGWMKTLGQAEIKWGQMKDSSGQVKDDMQAMVNKVRQDNAELVTEVSRQKGAGLDELLRSQVYRLQGQGLSQTDIMKSMETLLMAAGKTRQDIDKILGNIKVTFDFKTPLSDLDVFLNDVRDKAYQSGIFRGSFQGKEGMFEDAFKSTRMGTERLNNLAQDIMGKMVGLDDSTQKYVAEQLAKQLNSAMDQGFQDLKNKYGDRLKSTWQESASSMLDFSTEGGYSPKVQTGKGGRTPVTDAQRDLALQLNANRDLALKLAKAMNIPDDVAKKFKTFNDIIPMIGNSSKSATEVQKQYNEAVEKAEKLGGKLTTEQKKQMAAAYAAARGLDAAKLAANGYADEMDKSAESIKANNRGIEMLIGNLNDIRGAHGNFSGILNGSGDFWKNTADTESGFGGLTGTPEQQGAMLNDAMKTAYGNTMNVAFDLASMQAERQYQARMDGITNYYQGIKDRLQNESKQLDKSWQDRMQSFSDSWKDRIDSTKQSFEDRRDAIDDEIEAIEKQRDANKELDEQRQKMFEAEERRIERLTELANANIKYTRALASGNLDEAAMIMNNTERLQSAWGSQDSRTAAEDKAKVRDKADQERIDSLRKKQESLKDEEDAVLQSLEKQQEMEKRALEQQKENEKERLQNRIDGLAKEQAAVEQSERRKQELDRKTLEIQLATLKAFVPMNEAQLWEHIGRVQGAYGQHGIQLQFKGTQWGQIVGTALFNNVEAARVQLSNNSAWQQSGAAIGDAISKGAFGLSLGDFFNMIITGQPPAGWRPPGASSSYIPRTYTTGGPNQFYHTGGHIGYDMGGRNGIGGDQLRSDEIPIVAQQGEFMMSKAAVDRLGPSTLRALNSGKIGMGGSDLGFAAIGAGVGLALMRAMMNDVFLGSQKQQQEGSVLAAAKPGMYGNVFLNEEQLRNASIIANVGRSMGASTRDIVISLMTAMQESTLRNLNYGDRDSLGLFQQRPSMGWGTPAQVTNPEYAARKFFEGLLRVENRGSMPMTLAAQAVQRSAFPYAYANWQTMAEALVGAMGSDPNQLAGFGMFARMAAGINGAGTGKYVRPTSGPVTSEFGPRWGAHHDGIDIGAPTGTPIVATDSGRVISAGFNNGGFGYWTLVDHGSGLVSGYAHQSRIAVSSGQQVGRGQVIGYVGSTGYSTGPHLHFQMGGGPGRFQNPRNWIPSLDVGGTVRYDNVLANLHKDETVLTAPLSAALERGINQLDSGVSNVYHVDVTINGTDLNPKQLEDVVFNAMDRRKLLDARKVGKVR